MTPLYGHTNENNAYLVNDYPYGGLRCRIRFWVDNHPIKGARFVSQTENPKTSRWNNPRKGTYYKFGGSMYLDDKNHAQFQGISEFSKAKEILDYLSKFPLAPLSMQFKLYVANKRVLANRTSRGEAVVSIRKVPCVPSELEIAEARQEVAILTDCLSIIKSRT